MSEPTTHRQIVYRLLPGTPGKARKLAAVAGACRFVWNEILDQQDQLYTIARMHGAKPSSVSYFTLSAAFKQLRRATPWLQDMPFAPVRYTLKYQADAWQAFFRGHAGHPRFKARGSDSVTLPQEIRIKDGFLQFPKIGWMQLRRRGGNPYPAGEPVRVVIKRNNGKWYATVCYRVSAVEREDDGTAIGLDMNAGQVATSDDHIHHAPDMRRLEARMKRYSRKLARQRRGSRRRERTRARLAKTYRCIAMKRRDWKHHVSRRIVEVGHTVCIEDLNVRAMTAAGGAHKRGLNRVILDTGWSDLRRMLDYKAGAVIAVNPAYTSQTCAACGVIDSASRRSQAEFSCVACGHADNADVNAARNILASGTGASARGGCRSAGPGNREIDRKTA